ncbi:dUTP diphosphatase [Geobacillus stearothermophilus]|uniref:dUTP diphosphatase n=1 Tax=Geobacillus stearothermophilus TaxID=1422 RepID=UPI0024027972|nr:dUTP diphosphatase [Geobacillus stearothermophilus]MDF9296075.1 dUTP diphosphatase [Geobacillus stearothermophilus]
MNIKKLFEMQRQLDEYIEQKHPRQEGEDRLAKKILAFQVELGELANELPEVFKFWSNKKNKREKALEEFCDGLHFLLSVGLEITEPDMLDLKSWNLTKADNITEQFLCLMADVTDLYIGLYNDGDSKFYYEFLLLRFIQLGEMLGFTWDEIEEAYLRKNAVNHQRQESGY